FIFGFGVLSIFRANSEKRLVQLGGSLKDESSSTSPDSQSAAISKRVSTNFGARQLIGLAGALSLVIGAFTPLLHFPFGVTQTYVARGTGDGIILILLTATSVFLITTRRYRALKLCAGLAATLCLFTYIALSGRLTMAQEDIGKQLSGNMFRGVAEAMLNSISFGFGWAFLLVGLFCLFVSAWYDTLAIGEWRPVNRSRMLDSTPGG